MISGNERRRLTGYKYILDPGKGPSDALEQSLQILQDWERELSNTWYFDQNFRCVFQEKEHGPLAREQFDSVIDTKAVDVDLPIQDLSSVGSDEDNDSDSDISDLLQVNPLRHQLARAIERTEARAEKRKGAFTKSDSQVLSDGGNGSNDDNGGLSLPNAKRTKIMTGGVKGIGKKITVTEARAKKKTAVKGDKMLKASVKARGEKGQQKDLPRLVALDALTML